MRTHNLFERVPAGPDRSKFGNLVAHNRPQFAPHPQEEPAPQSPIASFSLKGLAYSDDFSMATDIFRTIDCQDSANPTIVGGSNLSLPTGSTRLTRAGNLIYCCHSEAGVNVGLSIIDVSATTNPAKINGAISGLPAVCYAAVVDGSYAYVIFNTATNTDVLRVLNVSDPAHPLIVGSGLSDTTAQYPQAIAKSGDYLHILFYGNDNTGNELYRVVDVSDPTTPFVVAGASVSGLPDFTSADNILIDGNYAYFGLYNFGGRFGEVASDGLRIVDISTPTAPVVVGGSSLTTLPANLNRIAKLGNYVVAAFDAASNEIPSSADLFRVIDVSTPSAPIMRGGAALTSLPLTGIAIVAMPDLGNVVAYGVTSNPNQIDMDPTHDVWLIDITDPDNPTLLGSLSTGIGRCADLMPILILATH